MFSLVEQADQQNSPGEHPYRHQLSNGSAFGRLTLDSSLGGVGGGIVLKLEVQQHTILRKHVLLKLSLS